MITGYSVSCPCQGRVIEGDLVKVEGISPEIDEGAFVECACGCLHRVHLVDREARLIALAKLTIDEQIEVHRMMGLDMVKLGCPSCDQAHVTSIPDGFDPTLGFAFACPDCRAAFTITERRDDELITRALSEGEAAEFEEAARRAAAARSVFGGWQSGAGGATGSTAFGSDPFGTFGGR